MIASVLLVAWFHVAATLDGGTEPRFISGRVLSVDGRPIRAVLFCRDRDGIASRSHFVGEDGRFRIASFGSEIHHVEALDPTGRFAGVTLDEVRPGTPLEIRLGPPRTLTLHIQTRHPPPTRFRIFAHDPDGHRLSATVLDRWGSASLGMELDSRDGVSLIRSKLSKAHHEPLTYPFLHRADVAPPRLSFQCPTREFSFTAEADGFAPRTFGPFHPDRLPGSFDIDLTPRPGLRGIVLADGRPLEDARVTRTRAVCERCPFHINRYRSRVKLPSNLSEPSASMKTGPDGRFSLSVEKPGHYYVHVEATHFASAELGPFEITPETGRTSLRIPMTRGGSVEGRVLLPEGGSLDGVQILLSRGDGFPKIISPESDGTYRVDHLTPGPWIVRDTVAPTGTNYLLSIPYKLTDHTTQEHEDSWGDALPFEWTCTIEEGQTLRHDLDLRSPLPTIRGRLGFGGRAAALSRATVQPVSFNESLLTQDLLRKANVDDRGSFDVALRVPGRYRLILEGSLENDVFFRFDREVDIESADPPEELHRNYQVGAVEVELKIPKKDRTTTTAPKVVVLWQNEGEQVRLERKVDFSKDETLVFKRVPVGKAFVYLTHGKREESVRARGVEIARKKTVQVTLRQ